MLFQSNIYKVVVFFFCSRFVHRQLQSNSANYMTFYSMIDSQFFESHFHNVFAKCLAAVQCVPH